MEGTRSARAYADLVEAVLDAAPPEATTAFDATLDELVGRGSLHHDEARRLRWQQRDSLRALRDHGADVLPATIAALVDSARGAAAALKPVPTVAGPAPTTVAGPAHRSGDDVTPAARQVRLVAGLRQLAVEGGRS